MVLVHLLEQLLDLLALSWIVLKLGENFLHLDGTVTIDVKSVENLMKFGL